MSKQFFLGALTLPLVLASIGFALDDCDTDPPCIPDDTTSSIEYDRPPLGQTGDPVNAEWTGGGSGSPFAYDDDVSNDDYMGRGEAGDPADTATIDVENKGGNLSGPNGDVVNGGLDGDCAEVYMGWSYRYPMQVQVCVSAAVKFEPGGVGGSIGSSECATVTIWAIGYKYSCVAEVCPC